MRPSVGIARARELAHSARGAAVVPQDRRAQRPVVGVEHHGAVHLAGQADRGGSGESSARCLARGRRRLAGRGPPDVRLLLRPQRMRAGRGERDGGRGQGVWAPSTSTALTAEVPISMPRKVLVMPGPWCAMDPTAAGSSSWDGRRAVVFDIAEALLDHGFDVLAQHGDGEGQESRERVPVEAADETAVEGLPAGGSGRTGPHPRTR